MEYYKQNEGEIKSNLGYSNYEQFKSDQYDNFVENENLWDDYSSEFVNKNYHFYEDAAQLEVDAIEKYIDFDYRYGDEKIIVKIPYFLLFLIKKGYKVIDGKNELMEDVLNEYVSYYKIARRFDLNTIDAQMKDGLLKIFLPHTEENKPQEVKIK